MRGCGLLALGVACAALCLLDRVWVTGRLFLVDSRGAFAGHLSSISILENKIKSKKDVALTRSQCNTFPVVKTTYTQRLTLNTPHTMQAIITKYYGPTNTLGSRLTAKCSRGRMSVSYDHARNIEQNHEIAATALCARFLSEDIFRYGSAVEVNPWAGRRISGQLPSGEYAHVFVGATE